jgi:hypothetical protein
MKRISLLGLICLIAAFIPTQTKADEVVVSPNGVYYGSRTQEREREREHWREMHRYHRYHHGHWEYRRYWDDDRGVWVRERTWVRYDED